MLEDVYGLYTRMLIWLEVKVLVPFFLSMKTFRLCSIVF